MNQPTPNPDRDMPPRPPISPWLAAVIALHGPAAATTPATTIGPSPWLAEIMRRHRQVPPPRARATAYPALVAALVAIAAVALWPALRDTYRAAYPSEPARQQALENCSRESPTFIRFLGSDRAACYGRFAALLADRQASR